MRVSKGPAIRWKGADMFDELSRRDAKMRAMDVDRTARRCEPECSCVKCWEEEKHLNADSAWVKLTHGANDLYLNTADGTTQKHVPTEGFREVSVMPADSQGTPLDPEGLAALGTAPGSDDPNLVPGFGAAPPKDRGMAARFADSSAKVRSLKRPLLLLPPLLLLVRADLVCAVWC